MGRGGGGGGGELECPGASPGPGSHGMVLVFGLLGKKILHCPTPCTLHLLTAAKVILNPAILKQTLDSGGFGISRISNFVPGRGNQSCDNSIVQACVGYYSMCYCIGSMKEHYR